MRIKLNFLTMLSILISLDPFGMYYSFFSQMPDHIPMHYNSSGQIDRLVNKTSIEVIIICALGIYGLCFMKIIEFIIIKASGKNPEGNKEVTKNILDISAFLVTLLFSGISMYYLFIATKSIPFDMKSIARLGFLTIGVVLAITGNFLPKLRQNKISGFRTPRTLKDTSLWFKAQRLTSRIWIFGGVLLILATCIPGSIFLPFNISLFIAIMIIPMIYIKIKSV